MIPVRLRVLLYGALFVVLLTSALVARPLVKSWAVDDQGRARVRLSQRQIFDEVGGKATFGIDVPAGLAVLATDLALPEEVGDISGKAYVGLRSQSVSAVADFTYLPLASKKLQLEIDYRAVEDTTHHSGSNRFSVGYPLSLEHVPAQVARYLARTSYDVAGRATWSHYTDATGTLEVKIQDPDLKRGKSDVEAARIQVVNSGAQLAIHLQVVPNSLTARFLQNRQAVEFGIPITLKMVGISSQVRLGQVQVKGRSLEADVQVNLYNLRETVSHWQAEALSHFHQKGVDRRDVAGALSTMFDVQVPSADITIRSQGDHLAVNANLTASGLDKCILGYLRLKEVLEPSLILERAHSEPLSVLVKNVNAVRVKRFRNVVAAVASSQDAGDCDYTFKLGFPRGRMALNAEFKYKGNLEAYAFASEKMKIPVIRQDYSLLKVHTTPSGLQGHALYEAQGAWFEGLWAICGEAAKAEKDLQAVFPASGGPVLEEGRLLVDLKKSRVVGKGWLEISSLAAYMGSLVAAGARSGLPDPLALDVRYDADREPGRILGDLYLKGASREEVLKAVTESVGQDRKAEAAKDLAPPALARPSVELPAEMASEMESDRKALGVTPWSPTPEKPAVADSRPSMLKGFLIAAASLLAVAGLAVCLLRRKANGGDGVVVMPSRGSPTHAPTVLAPTILEPGTALSRLCVRVVAGAAAGQLVSLPEYDVDLGRDDATELRGRRLNIAEPTISRLQAHLAYDPVVRKFTLYHVPAATNPTFVNESPVTQQLLKTGDTIQVGRMVLRLEAETTQHG